MPWTWRTLVPLVLTLIPTAVIARRTRVCLRVRWGCSVLIPWEVLRVRATQLLIFTVMPTDTPLRSISPMVMREVARLVATLAPVARPLCSRLTQPMICPPSRTMALTTELLPPPPTPSQSIPTWVVTLRALAITACPRVQLSARMELLVPSLSVLPSRPVLLRSVPI